MRLLGIFVVVFLGAFWKNACCNPVELELELQRDTNSSSGSSSQEMQMETTVTMTTASDVILVEENPTTATNSAFLVTAENEDEKKLLRRKCNKAQNQTKSILGNERLIPYPLCKPIQGLFYIGLCAVVCGLPLKSEENSCRFSNEDKNVFCDCGGADEGDSAVCGSGLQKMSHCNYPELAPNEKVCRAICRKLGKAYDFCMTPKHSRRAYCTCFDASRTKKKLSGIVREIEEISESTPEKIPAPVLAPLEQFAVVKQEEIEDDVDFDVDVDLEDESCDDKDGAKNETGIQKLRQQNTGSCHPVLSAYKMKICDGICGTSGTSCRVNRGYKTVFCNCPGNKVGPTAFCGPNAELYNHCFRKSMSNVKDCRSLCSEMGKRGELCLSPQHSQGLPLCSCFTQ